MTARQLPYVLVAAILACGLGILIGDKIASPRAVRIVWRPAATALLHKADRACRHRDGLVSAESRTSKLLGTYLIVTCGDYGSFVVIP